MLEKMYILSIILGIIMGYILFYYYKKKINIYHGPNSSIVKNTIYKDKATNKCYMFEPKIYFCGI